MTNGDKIRSMSDDELNNFLWLWKMNTILDMMETGGIYRGLNHVTIKEWLEQDVKYWHIMETNDPNISCVSTDELDATEMQDQIELVKGEKSESEYKEKAADMIMFPQPKQI